MATAKREKIGIGMLVTPELDPKATAKLLRDTAALHKKLSNLKVTWSQVTDRSSESLGEIKRISTAASAFASSLSDAAKSSFKELSNLGDQLEEAHDKAAALRKQLEKARTPGSRKAAATELGAVQKTIITLNKQIDSHRELSKKYGDELKDVTRTQKKYKASIESMAKYSGKNFAKDLVSSVSRIRGGGVTGVTSAVGGVAMAMHKRAVAKKAGGMAAAGGVGTPGDVAVAEKMAQSLGRLAGVVSVLAAVVKLIATATDYMADMNKGLLEGSTLAGDSAKSVEQYSKVMKDLRDTAVSLNVSWMRFGIEGKAGLQSVAAFSKETSGSLSQTEARMKEMGSTFGDPLRQGMNSFVIAAKVYGNALGMSATDTAQMMGQLVNEIGTQSGDVQKTMADLVHSAAASNIPVYKFMDMFRQALPSLDLYINRIEELTGVMKLLGQAMSPRDIKQFMEAFRQGFDQLDFKQRLKMVLVLGPNKINSILKDDFKAATMGMKKNFGQYGDEMESAMKAADPVKAMRKVMGKAMAMGGTEAAAIGDAQKLARAERLRKKGGALNLAGALRGAGLMSRMTILEETAKTLAPGGSIEGLGEQVAKQITGMSEQQYKAILQLQDTMGDYMSQIEDVGRTSNKDINANLMDMLYQNKVIPEKSDKAMEDYMKKLAKTDRKKAEKLVKQAAVMQIENDSKNTGNVEDLTAAQVDATMGIGDKIDSIIKVLLEKLYGVLNDVYGFLGTDLWGWITGNEDSKDTNKYLAQVLDNFKMANKNDPKKMATFRDMIGNLQALNNQGADTQAILNQSGNVLMDAQSDPKIVDYMSKYLPDSDDQKEFSDLMKKGSDRTVEEQLKLNELLKGMDPKDLIKMLSAGASMEATKATGPLIKLEEQHTKRKLKTQKEVAKERQDLDQRTKKLYEDMEAKKGEAGTGVTTIDEVTVEGKAAKALTPGAGPEGLGPDIAKQIAGATGKSAPKPSMSSPDGRSLTQAQKNQEATEKSGEEVSDTVEKHAKKQFKQDKDIYKGVTNVFDLLKQGIQFHPGFLMGPYKSTIKDATYESFEKALIGFAVLQAKMAEHPELQKALDVYGWQAVTSGVGLEKLSSLDKGQMESFKDPNKFNEWLEKNKEGGRQMGGPIHDTGMYKLHKGEAVLDPMTYGSVKRGLRDGGGGGPVTVNVHAAPNWTQQQFENAVVNVMDRVNRRH